jgi:hypothetical protein
MYTWQEESFWLCRYYRDHLENPPLNDQGPSQFIRLLYSLALGSALTGLQKAMSIINSRAVDRPEVNKATI